MDKTQLIEQIPHSYIPSQTYIYQIIFLSGNPQHPTSIYQYKANIQHKRFMDTAQLLKEARLGSAAAQKCLFDIWGKKMLLVCLRYLKNEQDAEEAMLDGFYKFFKNLHGFTYNGNAALHGWLKKIMVNECLMQLRKKNVFTIVTEAEAENIVLEEEALNNLSAKEILSLIIQLPVGYRTVFNLYIMDGMEHKEIAALLGIAEGTSKSQLSKAKNLLQKNLAQHGTGYAKQKAK